MVGKMIFPIFFHSGIIRFNCLCFSFLSEFYSMDTDDSQERKGRKEIELYSTLPLPDPLTNFQTFVCEMTITNF